jgi:galacturan 1,4-alpha-galacturonidase
VTTDPGCPVDPPTGIPICTADLTITGGGTIAGSAVMEPWWICKETGCWRPHLITISSARGLTIDGIHMRSGPNHFIEVADSIGTRIRGLDAQAPHLSPNTDGVNFYGGFDSVLEHSRISNGDDCISVVPTGEWIDQGDFC